MKKICLFLIIFLGFNCQPASAETVNLSTYYPAPFGVYDRLRLFPRGLLVGACDIGMLYVETPDTLHYCMEDPNNLGNGIWGFNKDAGVWTQNDATDSVYLSEMDLVPFQNLNVGIGTTTPGTKLHVHGGTVTTEARISTNANLGLDAIVRVGETANGNYGHSFRYNDPTAQGQFRRHNNSLAGNVVFYMNRNNDDVIFNGNVGIGTTPPGHILELNGNVGFTPGWKGLRWGPAVPRLESRNGTSAIYFSSDNDNNTQLIMRDRQFTIYGRLYGSGNSRYFGLLNAAGNWMILHDMTSQYIQLRANNQTKIHAISGGRIDIKIGAQPLDDLRMTHVAAAPSGYYAVYAP